MPVEINSTSVWVASRERVGDTSCRERLLQSRRDVAFVRPDSPYHAYFNARVAERASWPPAVPRATARIISTPRFADEQGPAFRMLQTLMELVSFAVENDAVGRKASWLTHRTWNPVGHIGTRTLQSFYDYDAVR